ncbi:MAG: hypothetical protein HY938_07035 [Nitrosomonadales bacterium]|nr:hypothetical protein [Nitrosomonadales bacterium]
MKPLTQPTKKQVLQGTSAVVKLGPGKRYGFNYDYCKGCGICVSEHHCGAINMVPEDI